MVLPHTPRWTWAVCAITLIVPSHSGLRAQDSDPPDGRVLTFGVASTLRAHSNLELASTNPGRTVRSDTVLSFGYSDETRTQALTFDASANIRAEDGPRVGGLTGNESVAFLENPNLAIAYTRQAARSTFSFEGSLRQSDISNLALAFDPTFSTLSLVTETGTRMDYSANTTVSLGTDMPFGLSFSVFTRGSEFDGTTGTQFFDRGTVGGSVETRWDLTSTLTANSGVSVSRYSDEDTPQTERDTVALSFGLDQVVNEGTEIGAAVGWRSIDDNTSGRSESAEFGLSYAQELSRGEISAELVRQLTTGGVRHDASVSRSFVFPLGVLELDVGVTDADGVSLQPTWGIAYARALARGQLQASLQRDVQVSGQSDVSGVLQGSLSVSQTLNLRSALSLGVSFVDITDVANTGAVTERTSGSLNVTYSVDLAQDWALATGAASQVIDQTGSTVWDHSLFMTLSKEIEILP